MAGMLADGSIQGILQCSIRLKSCKSHLWMRRAGSGRSEGRRPLLWQNLPPIRWGFVENFRPRIDHSVAANPWRSPSRVNIWDRPAAREKIDPMLRLAVALSSKKRFKLDSRPSSGFQ